LIGAFFNYCKRFDVYGIIFLGNNEDMIQFLESGETHSLHFAGGKIILSTNIKNAVENMLKGFMESQHFELVDIEYVKEGSNWFLRVFVDKEGGIDIEDCQRVSEFLSEQLDQNDPIPTAYFLEVSSPGAERPLKKPEDVQKAVGKHVFITTYEPVDGAKEFEGELLSFDGEELIVFTGKKKSSIAYSKVANARLAIVF
jgi:ribosome maturation factor RimP